MTLQWTTLAVNQLQIYAKRRGIVQTFRAIHNLIHVWYLCNPTELFCSYPMRIKEKRLPRIAMKP